MYSHHPSKDITGTTSTILKGKTICMCITGSVAAMTAPIIAREFMRLGAEVFSVMSKAAMQLITLDLMHWSTGNPVITELTGAVEHIAIAGDRGKNVPTADIVLVCPATANTISKIASGIDDTPVTTVVTTAFGSGIPIIIVPAMHECMYHHPILDENITKLKRLGVEFIGPRMSEGKAKIAKIDDIISRCRDIMIQDQELKRVNFLLTVGPTREFFDRVRFISNPSSGKMGMAIAEEILARGGNVTVIMTKGVIEPPLSSNVRTLEVVTAKELLDTILKELKSNKYDFFISAAAVSDFKPAETWDEKVSSKKDELVIKLVPNPKIIKEVRKDFPELFIVAFKAEVQKKDEDMVENAYKTLVSSDADLIVANDVGGRKDTGFDSSTNEVYIIDKQKNIAHTPLQSKRSIAVTIVDKTLEAFRAKKYEKEHGKQ
nr:bifunctional phosphopantothenoylcysteine decarboxylase/phosphopantothenate--cysteine ligase CoaBC [Candidatus Sigynarchaeota archaeon]